MRLKISSSRHLMTAACRSPPHWMLAGARFAPTKGLRLCLPRLSSFPRGRITHGGSRRPPLTPQSPQPHAPPPLPAKPPKCRPHRHPQRAKHRPGGPGALAASPAHQQIVSTIGYVGIKRSGGPPLPSSAGMFEKGGRAIFSLAAVSPREQRPACWRARVMLNMVRPRRAPEQVADD